MSDNIDQNIQEDFDILCDEISLYAQQKMRDIIDE